MFLNCPEQCGSGLHRVLQSATAAFAHAFQLLAYGANSQPGPGGALRLLIVNYEFPPVGGGAGRATYNIAKELASRGHLVHVLTSRYADQPAHETIDGICMYRARSWRKGVLDCGMRGALTFLISAFFKLRQLLNANRYDVVHYFFSLPTGLLSFYSHGVRGLPYVVSLRGSDVPGYDQLNSTLRFLHTLLEGVNKLVCKRATRVIALSNDQCKLALRIASRTPLEVIYNGVDANRFAPGPHRENTGALQLICVSRLIDRKGLPHLFEAMARLPGVRLTVAGDGPEEQRLQTLAQQLNLAERVRFLGYVPNERLRQEYQAADVFVLPTLSEALGSVVLEAMSCGLPVVATTVGGIPELIQEGVNGLLVPPGDAGALAYAIAQLAANPLRRQSMKNANVARIAKHFTWCANAERYERIYRHALSIV